MSVRVRFAPSPTGYLHIGGARTALFNWLYARHTGGTFVLRVEDTDTARNSQEAVDVILRGLKWLGLEWDEGPVTGDADGPSKGGRGPYFQSRRGEIYKRRVEELKERGLAYDHEGTVRFRMSREAVVMQDLVVGEVRRELTDREALDPDFVIVRSDGQPVFHFVNVVDDLEMGITHVIRGEDHLSNTAKHLRLFEAFGATPPKYAHIPLILNADGSKMSKRDQGASLAGYWEEGFLPEAVVNYLCLLGWSPKDNRELLPLAEVVALFDLPNILRHNARFDMTKLEWMNWEYIRAMEMGRFVAMGREFVEKAGFDLAGRSEAYVAGALATCKEKPKLLKELPGMVDFYFQKEITFAPEFEKDFTPQAKNILARLAVLIAEAPEFTADAIGALLKKLAVELGVKVGAVVYPTRLACTGRTIGPSLYHLMEVLGKEEVARRLAAFIARVRE